ncbi:steryl-sulfatase-like isoform X1, partial [Dinothrombium tinctorium]
SSDDHDEQKKLSPSFTSKFKLFNEHDSNVVLDFDEARFLKEGEKENKKSVESGKFLYQQKKKFDFENISLERGKHCVIDIDELVDILRQERMSDIAVISVPKELKYCDYMVIASAMSTRHLRAVCEFIRLVYKAKKHLEDPFVIVEGENSNDWKVFDMDSIVLHLMLPETRNLYDIETLWTCGAEHDNLTQKQVQDPIVLFIVSFATVTFAKSPKPNFLILLADDLGYGDVGAFGNTTLPTPNIDKLASEGVKLTHHLTAASVCTPSRAALLTGRYPVRYGMASHWMNRVFLFVASKGGLPPSEITFAKLLQQSNYSTAFLGKWHLGSYCGSKDDCHHPLNHGFDYFYGLPFSNVKDFGNDNSSVVLSNYPYFYYWLSTITCIGLTCGFILYKLKHITKTAVLIAALSILIPGAIFVFQRNIKLMNSILMRDYEVIEQPINFISLTRRLVKEANNFISLSVQKQQPFLLMVAFTKVHTAHFPSKRFAGKSKHGKFGDCVMEIDWAIGQLTNTLSELGALDNTFIYFSSDNGGHIEEVDKEGNLEGGYNGIFPGGKGHGAVEGGIRVPTLIQWKKDVPRKQIVDFPTSQMDLLPTIAQIANVSIPNDRVMDGNSLMPLIRKNNPRIELSRQFLFHYCGTYLSGIRYFEDTNHIWKLYYYTPNYQKPKEYKCHFMCQCYGSFVIKHNPPLLYNIAKDPGEKHNLTSTDLGAKKYSEVIAKINEEVAKHRKTIPDDVQSEFSFWKMVWLPWLQPCCNFPSCSCIEKEETTVILSDSKQ